MTFDAILAQVVDLLQRQGRVSYRALKRRFGLDDDYLEDLKAGREVEIEQLQRALERAGGGHGQIVAVIGEPGVGKSRLFYELIHSHRAQGWFVLESFSVSYGKATAYLPVIDLLKTYFQIADRDETRTIRAKVTGHVLTLDEALRDTIPALLALLDALPPDSAFPSLDPAQRRQRTL